MGKQDTMSTSDELARWRAARAKTRATPPNSPMFEKQRQQNAQASAPVVADTQAPVSDYQELLDGCTSVQVESIAASSEASRDHNIAKAVDGSASTYYSTKVDSASDAVEVQIMLGGRFNIRKIDIEWKYKPSSFQIQFSRWDGERFEWLSVVEKTMPDAGSLTQEIFIGNAGFAHSSGAVKILLRPDQQGMLGISDIQIFAQKSLIAPKRIEASSVYSKEYNGQMLCTKGVWSSGANPKDPVVLNVELAGVFHVRKMTIRWTHGGPRNFSLALAGEEADNFERYPDVSGPEPGKEPVQTVIFTDLFYGRPTGFIRIEMVGLNHNKFIGIEELQIVGDLDLEWRADRIARYEQAMAVAESPKSSKAVGRVHKAAARPVASPVVPMPKPVASPAPKPIQEAQNVTDRSMDILASKDAEIAVLREENTRLKAEAARMKTKLRDAKTIIDSIA